MTDSTSKQSEINFPTEEEEFWEEDEGDENDQPLKKKSLLESLTAALSLLASLVFTAVLVFSFFTSQTIPETWKTVSTIGIVLFPFYRALTSNGANNRWRHTISSKLSLLALVLTALSAPTLLSAATIPGIGLLLAKVGVLAASVLSAGVSVFNLTGKEEREEEPSIFVDQENWDARFNGRSESFGDLGRRSPSYSSTKLEEAKDDQSLKNQERDKKRKGNNSQSFNFSPHLETDRRPSEDLLKPVD